MRERRGRCVRGDMIRIANDVVEVAAATAHGPRVLVYAPRGRAEDNVFGFVDPAVQAKATSFGEPWHIYGGHRLWHAPEHPVLSYVPDNGPALVRQEGDRVIHLSRGREPETHLVKSLRLELDERSSRVRVEHRIENAGGRVVDIAPWALSVMAPGGQAIFPNAPFVPFPDALLPASRLVLWPYSSLADRRFRFGRRYTRLLHDAKAAAPQKLGLFDPHHGWAAYAVGDRLFVKRFRPPAPETRLADYGCNIESFTDRAILELETLGEQSLLAPGASMTHVEAWFLFCGIAVPDDDDAAESVLMPLIAQTSIP